MFDLDHRAALIAFEGAALMAGLGLLSFALADLFPPVRRRLFGSSFSSSLLRFSLIVLILNGTIATIDHWHPNPLAVFEIAGLLGVLGVLGLVLTQLIPSLRRHSGRWPPSM